MGRKICSIFITFLLIISFPYMAAEEKIGGKTLYVGGDGEGNYSSIQAAVENASDGDTVFVYSGIYSEHITIDKSIKLVGENKSTTIIDGRRRIGDLITVKADNVEISNFTIKNNSFGCYWPNAAIRLEKASYCKIFNCNIYDNKVGIYSFYSPHNTFINNTFRSNGIIFAGNSTEHFLHSLQNNKIDGKPILYLLNQSNITLDGIEVGEIILIGCHAISVKNISFPDGDCGLIIAFSSNIDVFNCSMNKMYEGIYCRQSKDICIDSCIVSEGNYGFSTYFLENVIVENSFFAENVVQIWSFLDENITLSNCEFSGRNGMIFDSPSNAFITNCEFNQSGFSFLGGEDIYVENCSFFDKAYLHCRDTENVAIKNCNFSSTYKIDISHANNTTLSNCHISLNKWDGIFIDKSGNTTVRKCIIERGEGRGIYVGKSYKTRIIDCKIFDNIYGVYLTHSIKSIIVGNEFVGNGQNAWFENSLLNIWFHNYWDDWLGIGPKVIWGRMYICNNFSIPWFNVDFFPKIQQKSFHYLYIINFHLHPWLASQQGCIETLKAGLQRERSILEEFQIQE